MVHLQEFSTQDRQDKLKFLQNVDLQARGFKIINMFEKTTTVEQMHAKIKELKDLSNHNPCERKFYWILKDDYPIGVITLRIALDGFQLHNAGHIGIAIDKPYRNQNYGTEAFKKICKIANNEYGIKDIIVMTLTDNIAGRTMIEKAGGKYWDTIIAADGEKLARYWIKSNQLNSVEYKESPRLSSH